jgi:hypothetical protein
MVVFVILMLILAFTLINIIYWWISVSNYEINLRIKGEAQVSVCRSYFDKMRKIIITQAQVKDDYLNSFQDIFSAIMEGRYGNDKEGEQSLMKMIKESNPDFSDKIFNKLMKTIEEQRNLFQEAQEKLIDIDRQHKSFRKIFPNMLILSSRSDLDMIIITSSDTLNSVLTQQENDIDLPLNTRKII